MVLIIEPYYVCPYCGKESHEEGMVCCGEAGHAELRYFDIDGNEYSKEDYDAWIEKRAYYGDMY